MRRARSCDWFNSKNGPKHLHPKPNQKCTSWLSFFFLPQKVLPIKQPNIISNAALNRSDGYKMQNMEKKAQYVPILSLSWTRYHITVHNIDSTEKEGEAGKLPHPRFKQKSPTPHSRKGCNWFFCNVSSLLAVELHCLPLLFGSFLLTGAAFTYSRGSCLRMGNCV